MPTKSFVHKEPALPFTLNKKVALITGAAQGIGQAIAEQFILSGATVILTDINHSLGKSLAKKLGDRAFYFPLDVSIESNWIELVEFVEKKFQRLDILVNNAGITGLDLNSCSHNPEDFNLDDWEKVHQINMNGVALGCKYAIKLMKSNLTDSSIINISSRSGLVGVSAAAAYASSKAAIRNHTKTVALYCAEKGYKIRCNSIHPAAILTPMWESMLGESDEREANIETISRDIPLKRMGEPEDVAYASIFLASEAAKYITGIELNIDGGILAGAVASPK